MISSRLRPPPREPGRSSSETRARGVVEERPARSQQVEPPLQVGGSEHLALDLRRHVGDAPEVGRARSGHPFDHVHVARRRELVRHPGPLGHGRRTAGVRRQLVEGVRPRTCPSDRARASPSPRPRPGVSCPPRGSRGADRSWTGTGRTSSAVPRMRREASIRSARVDRTASVVRRRDAGKSAGRYPARTSRSFAAKASGSPVWPYSPPRKPPWPLGKTTGVGAEPLGDGLRAAMGHLALGLDAGREHDPGRRRAQRIEVGLVVRAADDVLAERARRSGCRRPRPASRTSPDPGPAGPANSLVIGPL